MCYSEHLDEANGYQEEHGYVLVGHKVVVQAGETLMPWSPTQRLASVIMDLLDKHGILGGHFGLMHGRPGDRCGMQAIFKKLVSDIPGAFAEIGQKNRHLFFPTRVLLEDPGHGFHVAASTRSALHTEAANPFGVQRRQVRRKPTVCLAPEMAAKGMNATHEELLSRDWFQYPAGARALTHCDEVEGPKPPGVLVRVLVPDCAVRREHHAEVMLVIPPGEKETPEDIALCDEYNRQQHQRAELVKKMRAARHNVKFTPPAKYPSTPYVEYPPPIALPMRELLVNTHA